MVPRALDSRQSLVVLGLLAEQPLHPYGMRVLIRERGHDRLVRRGHASLYDAVRRLATAGLIEEQETTRSGQRPERTPYRLTSQGAEALRSWVRRALAETEATEDFLAGLTFMYVLPPAEVLGLLDGRVAAIDQVIETADAAIAAALAAGTPPIFVSEERYSQAVRRAERDWLAAFIRQVRSGDLSWPRPTTGRKPR